MKSGATALAKALGDTSESAEEPMEVDMSDGESYAGDLIDAIRRRDKKAVYAAFKTLANQLDEDEDIPEGEPRDAYADKD